MLKNTLTTLKMNGRKPHSITWVSIISFPRLHVTLIGMNKGGYRINGGIGFAIQKPPIRVKVRRSHIFNFTDKRDKPLDQNQRERLMAVINDVCQKYGFTNNITVEVSGKMKTNYGFGSGTAVRLSCLEALFILNAYEYDNETLIQVSGRGGTSGIGIRTFFQGGMILDIGRRFIGDKFEPSCFVENRQEPALQLQRMEMPSWDIGLCIPLSIPSKNEQQEKSFFEKNCPINVTQVYRTLYHVIFGLMAAVKEKDKENFCKALQAIQNCTWKRAEREQYGVILSKLEEKLYSCGAAAVGMSSLGPTLYFLADNVRNVISKMKSSKYQCDLIRTCPINEGRSISYD